MANEQQSSSAKPVEPRGFGEHTRGLPGEYAHEQGWGLDEEERVRRAASPQDTDGGNDYNYSAQDFGDDPVNMKRVAGQPAAGNKNPEEAARRALNLNDRTESDGTRKENR
jgi:hypothetical protein